MTEKKPPTKASESQFYQIRIMGYLDQSWSDWLDGLAITHEDNGETLLSGYLIDQAALFGILLKIQNLGVTLLSVNKVKPDLQS